MIFFLIAFLTPLSVNLGYFIQDLPVELSLFTEPLLILLLLIILIKFLRYHQININIFRQSINMSIILFLMWTLISAFFSTMPQVSFKFFISKLWLILPVFYIGISLFKDFGKILDFLLIHSLGVTIIVIYSTLQLVFDNILSKNAIHFAVQPFYNDHTAYGAILALLLPITTGMIFIYKKTVMKFIMTTISILFLLGIFLSYSRASWLGLILAMIILLIILLRIRFIYVLISSILLSMVLITFWFQIIDRLEKNNQDSSANLSHHILSITNISTDASNVERLNRWHCAIEMFREKPVFGWGPGTYQFQYAPYQLERMRTIISTNTGDVGNAHSEYLGPLAEQGLPGIFFFLLMTISILYTGFSIYNRSRKKEIRILALSVSLGFLTYFLHGFLNNFLDTDKLAVPFFGLAAVLLSLKIYHSESNA